MEVLQFDCGCQFPKNGNSIKLDIEKIPLNCKRTWQILSQGLTKGVFQLESPLGKQWCKKLKPEDMEHLAALGSILRPGCLRAVDAEGVSTTEHYCRRKNQEEPVEYYHPALKPMLERSFGCLIYQEQSMEIAKQLAGFNLQEADELRKAIGKKLADEMEKVKVKFLAGCTRLGIVNKEQAEQIFAWIQESQRYSFNKSHAVCYGINGYYSAYCKSHFPVQFFTSWLFHSSEKQDPKKEVRELINEAKLMNIDVLPPDICNLQPDFYTDGNIITFGLSNIKNIGQAIIKKLNATLKERETAAGKKLSEWSWLEFLARLGPIQQEPGRLGQTAIANFISVGAMRNFGSNRTKMLDELRLWCELSRGEAMFIYEHLNEFSSLIEAVRATAKLKKEGGGCHSAEHVKKVQGIAQMLENPSSHLVDTPNWIAGTEEILLGTSVSCARIDGCDTSAINCTCRDYIDGRYKNKGSIILGVEIQVVNEIKTRKGKNPGQKMARMVITDGTCAMDAICWPEAYSKHSHLLEKNNTVIMQGYADRKEGTFIAQEVYQADLLDNSSE
jgi:DNA polymerase III subunit alpha